MQTVVGRYQLRDELGRGGMASVYRAYDATLDREIALKLMAGHLAAEAGFQRRFEREARVIATLEHPNIVPVYDYGITDRGQPYLVMRVLRGGTLYDRLVSGAVTRAMLLTIVRQVAAALDYAHDRDIVHRDVKPVNILFDEKGNAYVSDFGIAKVRDATTNLTGNAILGTPAYMSPEQFMGAALDGRSDQYSLAVVVFEALSGRAPFVSDTLQGLMFQHINEPPPDIHTIDRNLPPSMSAVLRRALSKDPAERFPTVTDFAHMLEAAAAGGQQAAGDPFRQQLEQHYDSGLKAYQRSDWATAVDLLGRVIALDTGYRNAAQLHQTARYRLQEQRGQIPPTELAGISGAPTQYTPGAGGPVAAPAPARRSRLPLLLLLLLLLVGGGVAAYLFWPDAAEPEPTPVAEVVAPVAEASATATSEPTATPTPPEPTPVAGAALVVEVGSASVATDGAPAQPLANGAKLPLQAGTRVELAVDDGPTQLVLPTGARLYLDSGAEVSLTANVQGDPLVTVERGRLVAWSHSAPVTIASAFDGQAALLGPGLMGVTLNPGAVAFEVACLEGSCDVTGANDAEALRLRNSQATVVGVEGFADRPGSADRAPYDLLVGPEPLPTSEVVIAEVVPTDEPTAEPTEQPTAEPTPEPTATATAAAGGGGGRVGSGANTTVLSPNTPLDFENFGQWTRGRQETGTLSRSTAESQSGSASAAFEYDFTAPVNGEDYLVYTQEHAISGEPNLLRIWAFGDGSGHNLNAWITDNDGEIWAVHFGRLTHKGWKLMEGVIDADLQWPSGHIDGPSDGEIAYPISFRSFVIDRRDPAGVARGTVYLDDLTVATGAPSSGGASAPAATTVPGATAPGATATPEAVGVGAIIFTAGDSLLTVDPGGQPRILGTVTTNSCSGSSASAAGVTFPLAVPAAGCYPIGHSLVVCTAPDGVTQVLVNPALAGTSARSISVGTTHIVDADLEEDEGIIWAPNSASFLYVVGPDVYQAFPGGGFQRIFSQSGVTCPRWTR